MKRIKENSAIPRLLVFLLFICATHVLASECIRVPRAGKSVDFAFVIDSTGSMGGSIGGVKNNARRLIDEKLLSKSGNRVAVTTFEDYCDGPRLFVRHCNFTTSAAVAKNAINGITIGDGGDEHEAHWTALYRAYHELSWKWGSGTKKAVALMSDTIGHRKNDGSGEIHSQAEIISLYRRAGIERNSLSFKEMRLNAAKEGESGSIGGISVFPIVPSYVSYFYTNLVAETEGEIIDLYNYDDVAEAVEDLIDTVNYPNGFETNIVSVVRGESSVSINVYGGSKQLSSSVRYQVVDGSALNGQDYSADEGEQVLTWEKGDKSYQTITIPLLNTTDDAETCFFSIILFSPKNMSLGGITVCRVNIEGSESGKKKKSVYIQVLSSNPSKGSVSGSGRYSLKRKAQICAIPQTNFVFTSWNDGSQDEVRKINTTEAYKNAVDGVVTYIASFIHIDNLSLPYIDEYDTIEIQPKEPFSFKLGYSSYTKATVTCNGLPQGLKCNDVGEVSGSVKSAGSWATIFKVRNIKGVSSRIVYFKAVDNEETSLYHGFLTDADNNVSGTVLFKFGKVNKKASKIAVKAVLKIPNKGRVSAKGFFDPACGKIALADKKGLPMNLSLTNGEIKGDYDGYKVLSYCDYSAD